MKKQVFFFFSALVLFCRCSFSEIEMPDKIANEQKQSLQLNDIESSASSLFTSVCCDCTMKVTNRSNVYTTAIAISPYWDGSIACGPFGLNTVLSPAGSTGSSSTVVGTVKSIGSTGAPNLFALLASNTGDEYAQTDCVSLRIEIDCGGTKYDSNITTDPHITSGQEYHVAEFGVDGEGQPETCSLVPLNLSWRCRNTSQNCLPNCHGVTPNG